MKGKAVHRLRNHMSKMYMMCNSEEVKLQAFLNLGTLYEGAHLDSLSSQFNHSQRQSDNQCTRIKRQIEHSAEREIYLALSGIKPHKSHLAQKQSLYGLSYRSTQCNNKYLIYFYTEFHTVMLHYQVNKCLHQNTINHSTYNTSLLKYMSVVIIRWLFSVTENNIVVLQNKGPSP